MERLSDLPKVAIVGRPNVGKSTLFNVLTETRKSVVKNQPGVTRDILLENVEVWGKSFDLIDTGGLTESTEGFSRLIRESVENFISSVDLVIVVMDGRAGMLPEDREVVRMVQSAKKEFVLVINKIDKVGEEDLRSAEFYEFGADLIPASIEQRRGVAEILEWITERIDTPAQVLEQGLTITIVGKPNVGKSSMINRILGDSRVLVSETAGTTVDAVEIPFTRQGRQYTLIDTAGLRRSARREEDVEIISAFKSMEAIRKADLVLLMIDAAEGPTDQDARILQEITEQHKGVLIVANKVDLSKQISELRKTFRQQISEEFHFFSDIPMVFTSALSGKGLDDMFDEISRIEAKMNLQISTPELNDFFFEVIRRAPAPVYGTRDVKFYYLTQTRQRPPAFIAFANHPEGVIPAYRRFLIKHLKERFDLHGIPLRLFVMKSRGKRG